MAAIHMAIVFPFIIIDTAKFWRILIEARNGIRASLHRDPLGKCFEKLAKLMPADHISAADAETQI